MPHAYPEYKFLYPPRPEHKISEDQVSKYDNNEFIAQPKYNGSCSMIFMNDKGFLKIMNRHTELSLVKEKEMDFLGAYRGEGFIALAGELLNKNKKGEDGNPFNQKFIIWDILVYNGIYLVGWTTEKRLVLLETLYPCNRIQVGKDHTIEMYNHICCTGIKGIYKAPTYLSGFSELYKDLVKTDLYEGLLLKRKHAELSYGYNEKNNTYWQIKVRRSTKNYYI